MIITAFDNILDDPDSYVEDILNGEFIDVSDGVNVFKNIQPRDNSDRFSYIVKRLFNGYDIAYNFIRKSPLDQDEPNYIHTDEMMGDITIILYLNKVSPEDDGTIIYDNEGKPAFRVYSKYNRMIAFEASLLHSRSIFRNFGDGDDSRLIQVIFLKKAYE